MCTCLCTCVWVLLQARDIGVTGVTEDYEPPDIAAQILWKSTLHS